MKTLTCHCGSQILVDDEDYDKTRQFKWHCSGRRAVVTSERIGDSCSAVPISRVVLDNPTLDDGIVIDHADTDIHNNQKSNLRKATSGQNTHNSRKRKDNTSGFKGVSFNSGYSHRDKPWQWVLVKDRIKYRGHCQTAEQAAKKYDEKAVELYGEFARTNFPLNKSTQSKQ